VRWQVERALDSLLTPDEVVGVLTAIAPQVGFPRVVAAAPAVQSALGISDT
jgi:alkylhydroperoxidase/carboxymuconolactone decarboxylase family protein YurZ